MESVRSRERRVVVGVLCSAGPLLKGTHRGAGVEAGVQGHIWAGMEGPCATSIRDEPQCLNKRIKRKRESERERDKAILRER